MAETETPGSTDPAKPPAKPWLRGLFMLAFVVFFALAETLLHLLALVQFLSLVITGQPNQHLVRFGAALAVWMADVARFQTAASEEKPFPWRDWPDPGA